MFMLSFSIDRTSGNEAFDSISTRDDISWLSPGSDRVIFIFNSWFAFDNAFLNLLHNSSIDIISNSIIGFQWFSLIRETGSLLGIAFLSSLP